MITIQEKCLRSLDQGLAEPMSVRYRYRVLDGSVEILLRIKGGSAVLELASDHKLKSKQLSEILGVAPNTIKIEKEDVSSAAKGNPVPG